MVCFGQFRDLLSVLRAYRERFVNESGFTKRSDPGELLQMNTPVHGSKENNIASFGHRLRGMNTPRSKLRGI